MSRPISSESVFRAAAHQGRRRVLDMLRKRECNPGELQQALRCSGAALSAHLQILRDAGLVTQRREGRRRMYRLNSRPMSQIIRWADAFRAMTISPGRGA